MGASGEFKVSENVGQSKATINEAKVFQLKEHCLYFAETLDVFVDFLEKISIPMASSLTTVVHNHPNEP